MFCPPAFREDRPDVLRQLIRSHPLATLVTYGASGLAATLVPFTIEAREDGPDILRAHLARANDQLADLRAGAEVMVIFHGPQAYVTPSWYPTKAENRKAVPTWNYIVVQAWGRPCVIDDAAWLREQIDGLTVQQEQGRAEPWTVDEAPPSYVAALLKAISGVEIPIDRIEGKWKASQNQPAVNRAGVVSGLRDLDPMCPMAAIVEQAR
jgi:transcriptional regulator